MTDRTSVLFVVENDHFPQDMRVYNECLALSRHFSCGVLAPRAPGQKLFERLGPVRCYRYPAFHGGSLGAVALEYGLAWLSISLLVPLIALGTRAKVIHVANPPDFIVPTIAWLRLFGIKIVFDAHDISAETLKGKVREGKRWSSWLIAALERLESASVRLSNLSIATNQSIFDRIRRIHGDKPAYVVRNSNRVVYGRVSQIAKRERDGSIRIGYFGLLANDRAAGLDNLIAVAHSLEARGVAYEVSIVGSGPGLAALKEQVQQNRLSQRFIFHGFVPMPRAYALIKNFDFGLVTWGNLPKNHLHTAMKVMDYMSCAVPVCSLQLHEQLKSTSGIGIHASSFEAIAEAMVRIHADPNEYESLRRRTLAHFNEVLCWEFQESVLVEAYRLLLHPARVS